MNINKLSHPQIKALMLKARNYKERFGRFKFENTEFEIKYNTEHIVEVITLGGKYLYQVEAFFYPDSNQILIFSDSGKWWGWMKWQ